VREAAEKIIKDWKEVCDKERAKEKSAGKKDLKKKSDSSNCKKSTNGGFSLPPGMSL